MLFVYGSLFLPISFSVDKKLHTVVKRNVVTVTPQNILLHLCCHRSKVKALITFRVVFITGSRLEQNGIWNVLAKNVAIVKVFFAETFQISFRSPASDSSLGGVCGVRRHAGEWPLAHTLSQTLTGFKMKVDGRQLWVTDWVPLCWAAAVPLMGRAAFSWRFLILYLMSWTV